MTKTRRCNQLHYKTNPPSFEQPVRNSEKVAAIF